MGVKWIFSSLIFFSFFSSYSMDDSLTRYVSCGALSHFCHRITYMRGEKMPPKYVKKFKNRHGSNLSALSFDRRDGRYDKKWLDKHSLFYELFIGRDKSLIVKYWLTREALAMRTCLFLG